MKERIEGKNFKCCEMVKGDERMEKTKKNWVLNPNGFFEPLSLPKSIHLYVFIKQNPSRTKSTHFFYFGKE